MSTTIPFTQFLRPNGVRRMVTIEVSDEAAAKYTEIASQGCRMTVEELRTGEASMCVEHPDVGDFDCIVVPNGPAVPAAVEKLLLRFDLKAFTTWRQEMAEA